MLYLIEKYGPNLTSSFRYNSSLSSIFLIRLIYFHIGPIYIKTRRIPDALIRIKYSNIILFFSFARNVVAAREGLS